jgi:DNA polymerase elongation subunit (family B)
VHDVTPIYGLDIETDTTIDGLDPAVAAIVTIALSTADGDEVLFGSRPDDERGLFLALDQRLATLPPGILATWNGAVFDLPFLADRAARLGLVGGLRLRLDPAISRQRRPLTGHPGLYRGRWYGHRHLDGYRLYRNDLRRVLDVSCSLKSVARVVGLRPVEVDRERIHDLPGEVLAAYVASDARLARVLVERRWPGAARFVDAMPAPARTPSPA